MGVTLLSFHKPKVTMKCVFKEIFSTVKFSRFPPFRTQSTHPCWRVERQEYQHPRLVTVQRVCLEDIILLPVRLKGIGVQTLYSHRRTSQSFFSLVVIGEECLELFGCTSVITHKRQIAYPRCVDSFNKLLGIPGKSEASDQ